MAVVWVSHLDALMIEESARVLRVENDTVWVEAIRQSACSSCSAQKGCGHSLLAKAGQQRIEVPVIRNGVDVKENDQVLIGVPEQAVLRSSLLIYGAPLLLMMFLALVAHFLFGSEGVTALMAFVGLVGGFVYVNWKSQHLDIAGWQPQIVRILNSEQSTIPVCNL